MLVWCVIACHLGCVHSCTVNRQHFILLNSDIMWIRHLYLKIYILGLLGHRFTGQPCWGETCTFAGSKFLDFQVSLNNHPAPITACTPQNPQNWVEPNSVCLEKLRELTPTFLISTGCRLLLPPHPPPSSIPTPCLPWRLHQLLAKQKPSLDPSGPISTHHHFPIREEFWTGETSLHRLLLRCRSQLSSRPLMMRNGSERKRIPAEHPGYSNLITRGCLENGITFSAADPSLAVKPATVPVPRGCARLPPWARSWLQRPAAGQPSASPSVFWLQCRAIGLLRAWP